ncbi:hypothetical protein QAD02_016360 [Eretmocerus hayati]|uniref:Uncharacterized protein n=1 Tax=Eretmocerus hayati TaxID=131215 RepID=A0ACC2PAV6_9HYME|nr:hypothetical protein QAD02_016360 [Eretmocerus hayati]
MHNYINDKEFHRPGGWADEHADDYARNAPPGVPSKRSRQYANRGRSKSKNNDTTKPKSDAPFQSKETTTPKAEVMYNCTQGARKLHGVRCHNLDFSNFSLLCRAVWSRLSTINTRLPRELPYVAFLHSMNIVLQLWIIDTMRTINHEKLRLNDYLDVTFL